MAATLMALGAQAGVIPSERSRRFHRHIGRSRSANSDRTMTFNAGIGIAS
ncbi:hypothetical protein MNQ95_13855 [Pseudoxanthomonas daejeonensis]|nr:hypothetical protein [Pseudoxanthomonas daejeonensis]UNK57202.1 hypothetical protein MNQ95_13855 [Pseudoxanthomonas daejeonensis]